MNCLKYTFGSIDCDSIKLCAVGDVMFSRDVENVALKKGIDFFFSETHKYFNDSDISFCNLEAPITNHNNPSKFSRSNFKILPSFTKTIAKYFDVVSLANNHVYDYESQGAKDTIRFLHSEKIYTLGIGKDIYESHQPAIFSVRGVKIGFLGYTCLPTINEYSLEYPVASYQKDLVKKDLMEMNKVADVSIVSIHGGYELVSFVEPSFKNNAKYAIDCGADLVLGHHPHVISGIEIYQGKPLVYSLGNFIFDNPTIPERREGMLLDISMNKKYKIAELNIVPLQINEEYVPGIASDDNYDRIANKIFFLSNALAHNKNDHFFWNTASVGFIQNGKENLKSNFSKIGAKGLIAMLKRLKLRHFRLLVISVLKKKKNKRDLFN